MDVVKSNIVFDPLYGFINLTPLEVEIIHSPFFQRLRWIKQLGFSCYVFHGAEHSRYGHSIGVMHNAHHILKSCGRAVSDEELHDPKCLTKEAIYHKAIRVSALLHDIGTFCFSHTTEMAYIRFGETTNKRGGKGLKDDHENLGSFIIKNTNYEGGLTYILEKYGIDPQEVSDLVKGVHPSVMANQILHSEIDCDRMDYLLRDAHYTGLKYGAYDRDYLLHHFKSMRVGDHDILTIKHNALHCVEDFLNARFAWYSQVIRSPRGARYDAIAERVCFHFLEKGYVYRYSDLLDMISKEPMKFFGFNDSYFMNTVHAKYIDGSLDNVPDIKDMAKTLLLKTGAVSIKADELKQVLLNQDDISGNEKVFKKAHNKAKQIEAVIQEKGSSADWVLPDIPSKMIIFVKSPKAIAKDNNMSNLLLERDPVKISYQNGDVKLLADVENSIISKLSRSMSYTPNVFCSNSAFELLVKEGIATRIP
ncbi:HD domain-containing protein [Bacteriovorax sp. Seq25_V]|uniref:HD domain-containing protein n=1 Tax=Bacteriovorax sp. Seq25_V TaxID=1201288 RepID=UPI00038A0BDC|nr:HD domain-containing protein [Bacteriovorax sp. Seq25_V]EQC45403.1 HD domain protein [Bacteriovorax sp. Seq25_V]